MRDFRQLYSITYLKIDITAGFDKFEAEFVKCALPNIAELLMFIFNASCRH